MLVLGVDVGGSGMKGAIVDIQKGELTTDRFRIETPQPATPENMAKVFQEIVKHFDWDGPIGCGFPTIVKRGVAYSAGNIDASWHGTSIKKTFEEACGLPVHVINDADAAGLAEMQFGAGKDKKEGMVLMITIGTGLGSGAFYNGKLIPNFELGYIPYKKDPIEWWASNKAREEQNLSYKRWAKRFTYFLNVCERIFTPDLFIIGGGLSKDFKNFKKRIQIDTEIVPAENQNLAGIIGAALVTTLDEF